VGGPNIDCSAHPLLPQLNERRRVTIRTTRGQDYYKFTSFSNTALLPSPDVPDPLTISRAPGGRRTRGHRSRTPSSDGKARISSRSPHRKTSTFSCNHTNSQGKRLVHSLDTILCNSPGPRDVVSVNRKQSPRTPQSTQSDGGCLHAAKKK